MMTLYFYLVFFTFSISFLLNFILFLNFTNCVLPNIKMNPPQVYMCSPSWTLLPPPSFFYFIFSASIAFMFSDFSISFFNVLFQSFIKGRRKAIIYIYRNIIIYIPDQISRSVVSDSLRPHESQHTRPPCPSPTPGVHWDSHPSGRWCHPAISSSVVPFSSCP